MSHIHIQCSLILIISLARAEWNTQTIGDIKTLSFAKNGGGGDTQNSGGRFFLWIPGSVYVIFSSCECNKKLYSVKLATVTATF